MINLCVKQCTMTAFGVNDSEMQKTIPRPEWNSKLILHFLFQKVLTLSCLQCCLSDMVILSKCQQSHLIWFEIQSPSSLLSLFRGQVISCCCLWAICRTKCLVCSLGFAISRYYSPPVCGASSSECTSVRELLGDRIDVLIHFLSILFAAVIIVIIWCGLLLTIDRVKHLLIYYCLLYNLVGALNVLHETAISIQLGGVHTTTSLIHLPCEFANVLNLHLRAIVGFILLHLIHTS